METLLGLVELFFPATCSLLGVLKTSFEVAIDGMQGTSSHQTLIACQDQTEPGWKSKGAQEALLLHALGLQS